MKAAGSHSKFFKIPKSQTWDLPIELAQHLYLDYLETTARSRKLFNDIIRDHFNLQEGHTYFLRCGEFSSKFQFENTKCTDINSAGEQFHLISNFAMQVGAGRSNDIMKSSNDFYLIDMATMETSALKDLVGKDISHANL